MHLAACQQVPHQVCTFQMDCQRARALAMEFVRTIESQPRLSPIHTLSYFGVRPPVSNSTNVREGEGKYDEAQEVCKGRDPNLIDNSTEACGPTEEDKELKQIAHKVRKFANLPQPKFLDNWPIFYSNYNEYH